MDEKEYDCTNCCYRDKTVDFCGFCLRKIVDEFYKEKRESEVLENGKGYEQQCSQSAEQSV